MPTESKRHELGMCQDIVRRLYDTDQDLLIRLPVLAHDVQLLFELGVSHQRTGLMNTANAVILQQVASGNLRSGSLLGTRIPDECIHSWRGRDVDIDMISIYLSWAYDAGFTGGYPL